MSTADRQQTSTSAATSIASQLREAEFIHLVAAQTGDGVAAAGLLANALATAGNPYQTSVEGLPAPATRETDADLTVALGRPAGTADITIGDETACTSEFAYQIATELGTADPVLALAGHRAVGIEPDEQLKGALESASVTRRAGVAFPTADPVDGLVHSTLIHASFSGSTETAQDLLTGLDSSAQPDESEWQAIATTVALTVARDGTPRGASAVEQLLRPHVGGPFETVGGFGDVLDAVAREQPGQALALAMGGGESEQALEHWRTHAVRAHEALKSAETGRYNGVFVAQCGDGTPVGTVARLLSLYRSPEPVTLVVSPTSAAAVAQPDQLGDTPLGTALERAAGAVNGDGTGTAFRGRAQLPVDAESSEFILTFKEAL